MDFLGILTISSIFQTNCSTSGLLHKAFAQFSEFKVPMFETFSSPTRPTWLVRISKGMRENLARTSGENAAPGTKCVGEGAKMAGVEYVLIPLNISL